MKKALVLLFCLVAAFAFADKYDKWLDEVKVIITKDEKDAFKKLKSDAEKDKFMQEFWNKRDPSPGTPENENKTEYERRIQIATERLKSSGENPFDSDRGRTYLLLGNFNEQKINKEEETPSETWIYRSLPKEISPAEVQIVFQADEESHSVKFRDPNQAQALLDKARSYYANHGSMLVMVQQPQTQQPKVAKPTEAPTPALTTPALKTALDATVSGTAPKDIPINSTADFFMSSTDEPFVAIAVDTSADVSAGKVGVRVLDGSGGTVRETELPYANAEETAGHFQTQVPVTPATKSVVVAVANGDKTSAAKHDITIPETTAFSMSSILLAKSFKQLGEAKPEKVPYTFGKIKVQPSTDHVFAKADNLILVYEAYNFQIDSATGKPNLEAQITFQKDQAKPRQTAPEPPNGLVTGKKITVPTSFQLSEKFFEPGQYKLTITLTDKATNQSTVRETNFTVQ